MYLYIQCVPPYLYFVLSPGGSSLVESVMLGDTCFRYLHSLILQTQLFFMFGDLCFCHQISKGYLCICSYCTCLYFHIYATIGYLSKPIGIGLSVARGYLYISVSTACFWSCIVIIDGSNRNTKDQRLIFLPLLLLHLLIDFVCAHYQNQNCIQFWSDVKFSFSFWVSEIGRMESNFHATSACHETSSLLVACIIQEIFTCGRMYLLYGKKKVLPT